jgi:hypothetical protein
VVFIKTKMVRLLKFRSKLNGMPRRHQSHCATCPIIILKKKKIKNIKKMIFFKKKKKKKIKNFGGGYWLRPSIQVRIHVQHV